MKLMRLHLQAFGPFTDRILEFATEGQSLTLVYGPNEAGKSATLRAISDLRFGIPAQSRDNFIHAHPDLRVGGTFVDRDGAICSIMRRKGRGSTLSMVDGAADAAVPARIEAMLTCGLSKQDHDAMFGVDHARLRDGGEALLKGEGEVGAALFEASAGARSIPAILERLDQSARRYFMPGARGRNASINAALRAHAEQLAAYKSALVRPAHWAELSRAHQDAAQALERLEQQRRDLHAHLLEVRELRAVAPLLRSLDQAGAILLELDQVLLLAPEAPLERASAESGLADAAHNAAVAAAEVMRQQAVLDTLASDDAILAVGSMIERLAVAAESVELHENDLAQASADASELGSRVAMLAGQIDAGAGVAADIAAVIARIPAPAARAGIEQLLHRAIESAQALAQHRDTAARQATETIDALPAPLASAGTRIALRSAMTELARCDVVLQQAAALPMAVKAAGRAVDMLLAETGLVDVAAVYRARALLDGEIDAALRALADSSARRQQFNQRIDAISAALRTEHAEHDSLLAGGAVPTRAEVAAARNRREEGWQLVRGVYIDMTAASPAAFGATASLPQAFEQAVQHADAVIDALARDTARAAQLQGCLAKIDTLEADREVLQQALAALAATDLQAQDAWTHKLAAAALPAMAPAALREWQLLLVRTRAACERLQTTTDAQAQAVATAEALRGTLHAAIVATGMAGPAPDTALATLSALATEIEGALRQRDKLHDTAAGKRDQRVQQQQQMAERETELAAALAAARDALQPALAALLLPAHAAPAVVRARLGEFDALAAARDRRDAAQQKQRRAQDALGRLAGQAGAIAQALGDEAPADMRHYVERLAARLTDARAVQTRRTVAAQATAAALAGQRAHDETAARHAAVLQHLCQAAGVESAALLPQVEEQSRRKREAQTGVDRCQAQLAQASRHAPQALRQLLVQQDSAAMDADEADCSRQLTLLEEQLATARATEEAARHALAAVDSGDAAVVCREGMESAVASVHASIAPWMRSRLAHALLGEALKRFRERAQAPMLIAASDYFAQMTGGEFIRLVSDDSPTQPVLMAHRRNGPPIHVEAMSEGTRDQLYLALRLAALALQRDAGVDLPVLLDDALMTSDDGRAGLMLQALASFAAGGQVIVFTHHAHLIDVARANVSADQLCVVRL